MKQGRMTLRKVIRKFERLERLCPFLKLNEGEKIRKILGMFRPDIVIFVEIGGQPITMVECYEKHYVHSSS